MAEAPRSGGVLNRPILNKNNVPDMIKSIAAAKRAGAFTFQAGKADRYVNLAMGGLLLLCGAQVAVGAHKMVFGYGKKEGF